MSHASHSTHRRTLLSFNHQARILAGLTLVGLASAQTEEAFFVGDAQGDRFGFTVASLGDVNADGVADFAISAFRDSAAGGRVSIYSGVDQSLILQVTGNSTPSSLPFLQIGAVVAVGDINADGHADFGAVNVFATGSLIYSGADGSVLVELPVGRPRGGVGDFNADGFSDYQLADQVISGATGLPITDLDVDRASSARFVGDLNGDGTSDYLEMLFDTSSTTIKTHSGATHDVLHVIQVGPVTLLEGNIPSGFGDVDGDGNDDWGLISEVDSQTYLGQVFSGATGLLIHSIELEGNFHVAGLGSAGDVDGDGHADFLFFRSFNPSVPPRLYSGRTGSILAEFIRSDGTVSATSAVGIPDTNGDGLGEIVVGSGFTPLAPTFASTAALYSYAGAAGVNYCPALPNSTGQSAEILASGTPSIAVNHLTLSIHDAPAQSLGLFVMGEAQQQVPVGDGLLCVGGAGTPLTRLPIRGIDANGHMLFRFDVDSLPGSTAAITVGATRHFQAWFRDMTPGGAQSNLSDAVTVTFEP